MFLRNYYCAEGLAELNVAESSHATGCCDKCWPYGLQARLLTWRTYINRNSFYFSRKFADQTLVNVRKQATEKGVMYESIRNINIISLLAIETPRYLNFWRMGSCKSTALLLGHAAIIFSCPTKRQTRVRKRVRKDIPGHSYIFSSTPSTKNIYTIFWVSLVA